MLYSRANILYVANCDETRLDFTDKKGLGDDESDDAATEVF